MEGGNGNDILAEILDKTEYDKLVDYMKTVCPDTEETAALTNKFVPSQRQTRPSQSQFSRAPSPPRGHRPFKPTTEPRYSGRKEYPVFDPRAILAGPPDGPDVYHQPHQQHRHDYHHYEVRETVSSRVTTMNGSSRESLHTPREHHRSDRVPGTLAEDGSVVRTTKTTIVSTETTVLQQPQAKQSVTRLPQPSVKAMPVEDLAAFILPQEPLVLPPQVIVAAPLFTENETIMEQGRVAEAGVPSPPVVASVASVLPQQATPPVVIAVEPVAPAPQPSVGPPEPKEAPKNVTEAVAAISGFANLSRPCSVPITDITDMSPLKTLRAEFHAERQGAASAAAIASAATAPRPNGIEVTEVGFEDKKQPPSDSRALDLEDTTQIVKTAEVEKAHHDEAKKRLEDKKRKVEEGGGKEEKKKEKKHKDKKSKKDKKKKKEDKVKEVKKEEKKKKKDKDGDKKKKKKSKDGDKESEKKKKKKKDKKKHKEEEDDDDDKKKTKDKKKHKSKEEKKKAEKKKKKREERKKRRQESLLADEASEADSDEEIEDGSLDSDEQAAEDEDSGILSDTSGEDASEEDSEADEEGNLKDFVADDIEYEEDASEEGEEIHGRNEHTKYAESGPRVLGKKARKLKKFAKEQEHRNRKVKDDSTMHKTEDIGASLLREQEQLYSSAKKKRHIDDEDDEDGNASRDAHASGGGLAFHAKSKEAKSAHDEDKLTPLPAIPMRRTGEPLDKKDIEPILCSMAQCIAGYLIAKWHEKESSVNKSKTSKSGYGVFSDDFNKYTRALETSEVVTSDLPAASVFAFYFGPDAVPIPEDTSKENLSNMCLNGLARRIFKEMGRVGLLPEHVTKRFTSATPSDVMPTIKASSGEGENFVVALYGNGELVHEMPAAPMMKDVLSQVCTWFKAFSMFEEITYEFVKKTYSVNILYKASTERVSKRFINSYDDIAGIVNNKFVSSCDAKIHAAVAMLMTAHTDASEFLISLRQS